MHSEPLGYAADGVSFIGHLAFDESAPGPRPGIIVAPEGGGMGPFVTSKAAAMAELGYVALATDVYGGGTTARDTAEALRWIGELTARPDRLRARMAAALEALGKHPAVDPSRVAAMGYCFGGTCVLELARAGADVAGTVGFHCVLKTLLPASPGAIRGKVVLHLGADDPLIPAEQRAEFQTEMRAAGASWEMTLHSGARHSFTNPEAASSAWDALAYDRTADLRSWASAVSFLQGLFG